MKNWQLVSSLGLTGVVSALVASPAIAQVTQITGVSLNQTTSGLQVLLETTGKSPQVVTSSYDRTLLIDLFDTQLDLPDTDEFRTNNPTPAIATVSVKRLYNNSVRVTVVGTTAAPKVELLPNQQVIALNLTAPAPTTEVAPTPTSEAPVSQPSESAPSPTVNNQSPQPTESTETAQEEEIEVIVTATRTAESPLDVPRSVTVITREQIEQQATVTKDLQDILSQLIPGLGPPSQLYTSFGQALRGRRPQVLIDGVPVSTNLSTAYARDLRTISPEAIEKIEVVRGPSAIYGDGATGGVINIITRKAPANRFISESEIGTKASLTHPADSFGYNLQHLISGQEGNVDYTASFSIVTNRGSFDAAGDRIPLFDNGAEDSITLNGLAKLGIDITDTQRLQLTFNHYNDRQQLNFISDPIVEDIPGKQKARALARRLEFIGTPGAANINTLASLNYSHDNIFGSKVQAQAYFRDTINRGAYFDSRIFDPDSLVDVARSRQETERIGGRLQIETPLSAANTAKLLWGLDYVTENVQQPFDIFDTEKFDSSGGRILQFVREGIFTPAYQVDNLGLFAQAQWDITDSFLISGGLRHERIGVSVGDYTTSEDNRSIQGGDLNYDATVFNAGVVYRATEQLSVFSNFSQGFSVPDFGRILRRPPNGFTRIDNALRVLEPVKVNNYEIGVRGEWSNIQASLAGFYNTSELGSTLRVDRLGFLQVVRAPQRNYGIEATLDVQPVNGWQVGTTVSWTEGENDPSENSNFIALDSSEIQPLKLTAYLQNQTTPGWLNRLQMLYVGDRDRGFKSGADAAPIESYVVFDYISSIKLGNGNLQIGVQNLLNNQYTTVTNQWIGGFGDSYNLAASGRTLSVNYRLTW